MKQTDRCHLHFAERWRGSELSCLSTAASAALGSPLGTTSALQNKTPPPPVNLPAPCTRLTPAGSPSPGDSCCRDPHQAPCPDSHCPARKHLRCSTPGRCEAPRGGAGHRTSLFSSHSLWSQAPFPSLLFLKSFFSSAEDTVNARLYFCTPLLRVWCPHTPSSHVSPPLCLSTW